MKSTAENLSPTRVKLSVEVPFEELKPSLDAAYKKIGAQIRIPGFRPGKVPARIIDQRVGRDAVLEEAFNELVPQKYVEAAREHELKALGQPTSPRSSARTTTRSASSPRSTSVPRSPCPSWTASPSRVDDAEVEDSDVDTSSTALRERFGSLAGVERPVETGDYVSLDLIASIDGEEIEAGSAKGVSYEVGAGDLHGRAGRGAGRQERRRHRRPSPRPCSRATARARTPRSPRPSTRSRSRNCPSSTTTSRSWPASSTPSTS